MTAGDESARRSTRKLIERSRLRRNKAPAECASLGDRVATLILDLMASESAPV